MRSLVAKPYALSRERARRIWLHAQRLDAVAPFGKGPAATRAAVEHLGYVQKWNWVGKGARRARKALIEEALHRFERFQLAR